MANVRIVTDSLADIPPAIAKELDITQVPCVVRFGDQEFHDRVDLTTPNPGMDLIRKKFLGARSDQARGVELLVVRIVL